MGGKEDYDKCFDAQITKFNTYDQYVDVVSCWEEFLTNSYKKHFDDYFFDRYPSIPQDNSNPLTPDFTVYFSTDYGIIFEVSRTLPKNNKHFNKELRQIEKYTNRLSLKAQNGRCKPKKHDVVLIVASIDSFTIAEKLNKRLKSDEFEFESNIILLEYMYSEHDKNSGYQFRKIPTIKENFRDTILPKNKKLSSKLGMKRDRYENIFSTPNDFKEKKVTGVFCNDKPTPLYSCCYLWHKVFHNYLKESQRKEWNRGNPNKTFKIKIKLDKLQEELNERYIPNGFIRKKWLRESFEYLELAGLAQKKKTDIFSVSYRNLQRKRNKYRSKNSEKTDFADLARVLAEKYCKKKVDYEEEKKQPKKSSKKKKEIKSQKQKNLTDF